MVVLCAYPFNNVNLMLTAGIGQPYDPNTGRGVVGKNYCLQTMSGVQIFVEDEINPFIGTGVNPAAVDDFQGDNFDHGGLGFFGGGYLYPTVTGGRPIQVRGVPPGTPRWGSEWKKATTEWYNHTFPINAHGTSYAWRTNYLDLDPTYKDAIGRPLIAHDVQLQRQRPQDVGVPHRQGDGDRARRERQGDRQSQSAHREFRQHLRPVVASHRRRDHGHRSEDERGQPLSAELGREQSLRHGRRDVPAEPRLQPDGTARRARLLVGGSDHDEISSNRPAR